MRIRRHKIKQRKWKVWFLLGIFCLILTGRACYILLNIPWLFNLQGITALKLSDGRMISQINGKLVSYQGDTSIDYLPLNRIPLNVRQAVIAVEDTRFYQHLGVDPIGISRAVVADVRTGSFTQGGSTITQQLVKNLFLTNDKQLLRKGEELILALAIERQYEKDEILEMYLNQVYFGRGFYGIQQAAQGYFGKNAWELDLAESALLIGVLKNPTLYAPRVDNLNLVFERRRLVLQKMMELCYISPTEMDDAVNRQVHLKNHQ